MASATMFTQLKKIIPCLVDNNGNFRAMPIGVLEKRKLGVENIELMRDFITLLREGDFINEASKLYIFNEFITSEGVADKIRYGELDGKKHTKVNKNTIKSKIDYDRRKLEKILGSDFLSKLLYKSSKDDFEIARKRLLELIRIYKLGVHTDLKEQIALKLDSDYVSSTCSDEDFSDFIKCILPYTKFHMNQVSANLNKNSLGYFNYLLNGIGLSEEDDQRLKYIMDILNPKDDTSNENIEDNQSYSDSDDEDESYNDNLDDETDTSDYSDDAYLNLDADDDDDSLEDGFDNPDGIV